MIIRFALALLGMASLVGTALAQDWPARQPIRAIVTNTPGSALDIAARLVFTQVARQVGQSIVVDNRPGAANTLGIGAVAKSDPDGYTVLVTTSAIAITPHTHKNLPYDTARDLRAVAPLGNVTNVMIAPAKRFGSLQTLVAAAKVKPDGLSYASIGPGSTGHLSAEQFALSAGFKALHVPFKGSPEAVRDVAAGRVDFFFTPVVPALGLIREAKVDALVVSSSNRSSLLPDIRTTVEAGFPGSGYDFWIGVFVPSGTASTIADRLNREIRTALQTGDVRERLVQAGTEIMDMSRAQFEQFVRREVELNGRLVKAAGLAVH